MPDALPVPDSAPPDVVAALRATVNDTLPAMLEAWRDSIRANDKPEAFAAYMKWVKDITPGLEAAPSRNPYGDAVRVNLDISGLAQLVRPVGAQDLPLVIDMQAQRPPVAHPAPLGPTPALEPAHPEKLAAMSHALDSLLTEAPPAQEPVPDAEEAAEPAPLDVSAAFDLPLLVGGGL